MQSLKYAAHSSEEEVLKSLLEDIDIFDTEEELDNISPELKHYSPKKFKILICIQEIK